MDFADDSYFKPMMELGLPAFAPLHATNLWSRDTQIRKQFQDVSTHSPDVFTLPRDHTVEQQAMLQPCEDLEFLLHKFQRDVGAVMGVPEEMVSSAQGSHETVRKTVASGRIFSSKMTDICWHLQDLLARVYEQIYKKKNVKFVLLPMPRLEVETVQDMKVLFDIGAVTPDMSLQLSHILMGEDLANKRRRVELTQANKINNNGTGDATQDNEFHSSSDLEAVKQAHTIPKGMREAYTSSDKQDKKKKQSRKKTQEGD